MAGGEPTFVRIGHFWLRPESIVGFFWSNTFNTLTIRYMQEKTERIHEIKCNPRYLDDISSFLENLGQEDWEDAWTKPDPPKPSQEKDCHVCGLVSGDQKAQSSS